MLLSGIQLTIVGMTIVYLFLFLLVLVINVLAFLVKKYFPEQTIVLNKAKDDKLLIAAIVAGIKGTR